MAFRLKIPRATENRGPYLSLPELLLAATTQCTFGYLGTGNVATDASARFRTLQRNCHFIATSCTPLDEHIQCFRFNLSDYTCTSIGISLAAGCVSVTQT